MTDCYFFTLKQDTRVRATFDRKKKWWTGTLYRLPSLISYKYEFVADDFGFPGHNCGARRPNKKGFYIHGFGETDGLLVSPINSAKTEKKFNQLA